MKLKILGLFAVAAMVGLVLMAGSAANPLKAALGSGLFALVSLLAGALGVLLAIFALQAAHRLNRDVNRLAHSLDAALKSLAGASKHNSSTIEELADTVNRDIGRLSQALDRTSRRRAQAQVATGGNIVALPTGDRIPRDNKPAPADGARPAAAGIPAGPLEICLEPIISVSDSAAIGFEAYADVRLADGEEEPLRRLGDHVGLNDRIAFERALLDAAATVSRRQLGQDGKPLPIHVAVSTAFLEDPGASERLIDLFRLHPDLETRIVLSLDKAPETGSSLLASGAMAKMARAGVRFACETAPDGEDGLSRLSLAGFTILKLPVRRLLDRQRGRNALPAADIPRQADAAKVMLVVSGVATDEDVLALLDLGVDVMSGPRFSGPRRLRPAMAQETGAVRNG
jgi:cyclic-di-GMP phosphodiesterase TipF (flagellum assembly factor)